MGEIQLLRISIDIEKKAEKSDRLIEEISPRNRVRFSLALAAKLCARDRLSEYV